MADFEILEEQFENEVDNLAEQVDPNDEQDWGSLTLGWALGKGLSPEDANDFADHIRWDTDLG